MKKTMLLICVMVLGLMAILTISVSCKSTTQPKQTKIDPTNSPVNTAIINSANFFINRLVPDTKIGIIGIENTSNRLSDYITEELWSQFANSSFVVLERNRLDIIRNELNFQMSGEVSDDSFQSVGQFYGTESLVYGKLDRIGPSIYRLVMYATNVQRGSSIIFTSNFESDDFFIYLLSAESDEIKEIPRISPLPSDVVREWQLMAPEDVLVGIGVANGENTTSTTLQADNGAVENIILYFKSLIQEIIFNYANSEGINRNDVLILAETLNKQVALEVPKFARKIDYYSSDNTVYSVWWFEKRYGDVLIQRTIQNQNLSAKPYELIRIALWERMQTRKDIQGF
jgi:hypothetical protein